MFWRQSGRVAGRRAEQIGGVESVTSSVREKE